MLYVPTATHEQLLRMIRSEMSLMEFFVKRDEDPEFMALQDLRDAVTEWVNEGDETFKL